ncbi:MAG: hypothetical protein D4R68_07660 [Ignavibacteriales bacterium]|nr:MAG: hypothetical protein D4R68_07660 [Ignavibacteriales bacterium]
MPTFFDSWLPFIYLYVGGGIFFLAGMIFIRKTKAIDMRLKRDRFWWKVMLFGFIYYMVIHAFLIIAALYL